MLLIFMVNFVYITTNYVPCGVRTPRTSLSPRNVFPTINSSTEQFSNTRPPFAVAARVRAAHIMAGSTTPSPGEYNAFSKDFGSSNGNTSCVSCGDKMWLSIPKHRPNVCKRRYSFVRCGVWEMNNPPLFIQPLFSPTSDSKFINNSRVVASNWISTSFGRNLHTKPATKLIILWII